MTGEVTPIIDPPEDDHAQAPKPAAEQPAPAPTPPEKDHFQIVYTKYDDGDAMHREGVPSKDPEALTEVAVQLLRRYDVHEVFLVTVHASFGKEIIIKKKL